MPASRRSRSHLASAVTMGSGDGLFMRVRAEYREMPGLSLTAEQAARLMGVDLSMCRAVLQQLVMDGVLYHTRGGAYVASPVTRQPR